MGIPAEQSAVVRANIRAFRLRNGWTQAKLGELMGRPTNATVCVAEGHRTGRQRGFSAEEVTRLADIFGVSLAELTTRCVNCGGHPAAGFACLTCGALPDDCILQAVVVEAALVLSERMSPDPGGLGRRPAGLPRGVGLRRLRLGPVGGGRR